MDNMEEQNTQVEIESLRKQLDLMGIKYHPATGVVKLRELVKSKLEEPENTTLSNKDDNKTNIAREKMSRLKRVVISCLNPNKRELTGEIFTVSNDVGTFKKFIPFNNENGWHVPNAILDYIKERKYQTFITVKSQNNIDVRVGKYVPEYNIVELPPLTEAELKELARQQAITRATEE